MSMKSEEGSRTKMAMTNEELILKAEIAVKTERRSTSEVVRLFQEISSRKLYLERGFPNLYEMATKHFGYCAGSAMRRINAMRLTSIIPEIESKLESGELSLSVASEVQSFFYAEAREARPYSLNAKIELIETCLNKSRSDVERELVRRNPEREKRESVRHTSVGRVRVSFSISDELNQKLNRLKDFLSQSNPSTEDLLDRLAELGLYKFDPERKAARAIARQQTQKTESMPQPKTAATPSFHVSSKDCDKVSARASAQMPPPAEVFLLSDKIEAGHVVTPAPRTRTRYIPARERQQMKHYAKGCAYRDEKTGRRCGHTKFLERDHIEPYSQGGANTAQNLRWLCSAHNKWSYAQERLHLN
jgi:hypothetical protein